MLRFSKNLNDLLHCYLGSSNAMLPHSMPGSMLQGSRLHSSTSCILGLNLLLSSGCTNLQLSSSFINLTTLDANTSS